MNKQPLFSIEEPDQAKALAQAEQAQRQHGTTVHRYERSERTGGRWVVQGWKWNEGQDEHIPG